MLPRSVYWTIVAIVTLIALVRGRREEQAATAIIIVGSLLTSAVSDGASGYDEIELGVMTVDLACLAGFTAIALYSRRFWPLWVAGFQLASNLAHLLRTIHAELMPTAYAVAERLWIYPILLVVAVGAIRARSRGLAPTAVA